MAVLNFRNAKFLPNFISKLNLSKVVGLQVEKSTRVKKKKLPNNTGINLQAQLKSYLKSKPSLESSMKVLPPRFFKVLGDYSLYSFIIDRDVAADVLSFIKPYLKTEAVQIENCPGLGLLTEHLLNNVNNPLIVFDTGRYCKNEKSNCSYIDFNMFDIFRIMYLDQMDNGDRFEKIFGHMKTKSWIEEPSIQIIGVALHDMYLTQSLQHFTSNLRLLSRLGRLDHFFIIPDNMHEKFVRNNSGSIRKRILFNIFYTVKVLGTIPRKAVLPWTQKMRKMPLDEQKMYVTKITPREDYYTNFNEEQLPCLYSFLTNFAKTKHMNVIEFFERWAPGSGIRLIANGIKMTTEISDLSPEEVVQIFKLFFSMPQVNMSIFENIEQ